MNWLDVVVIVIFAGSALDGLNKGFIITLFNLISFFLAAYIAKLYYPILAQYIYNNTSLFDKINDFVYTRVFSTIENSGHLNSSSSILDLFNLPMKLKEVMGQRLDLQEQTSDLVYTTGKVISERFTELFIDIISVLLVFLIVRFLLMIIVGILDNIANLPVIRHFNRLSGLTLGIVKGVLVLFIIFTILTPIISMYPEGFIANGTLNSTVGYYFYSNNLIVDYLNARGIIF